MDAVRNMAMATGIRYSAEKQCHSDWLMASSQIVPHFEAKGVDVCGFNKKKIIIQSDIGI